jgi:stage II sporulation protein D
LNAGLFLERVKRLARFLRLWLEKNLQHRNSATAVAALVLITPLFGSRGPLSDAQATPDYSVSKVLLHPTKQKIRVLVAEGFTHLTVDRTTLGEVSVTVSVGELTLRARNQAALHNDGFELAPGNGRLIRVNNKTYRGVLEAFVSPAGQTILVNECLLEDYLKGVVPKELGPRKYPYLEALKAQSVAARTFAISALGTNSRYGFDVYPDERSQVYGNVDSEDPLSNQAVEETAGVFAVFQGEPIVAFYSSTCGGRTASYHETFLKPEIPYLAGGVKCPDSSTPYAMWEAEVFPAMIQDRLDRYASVGRLKNLEVLRRDPTGRVVEMRFTGSQGSKVVESLRLRYALGLRSHYLDLVQVRADPSGFATSILVKGRGFGHGVGLCQVGSVELAKQGLSFQRILATYYQGISLLSSETG